MKSQTVYFSISLPLIRENIRRFWAIPALSFLIYFLSGIFPILISYSNINRVASYINLSLTNMQPFYMAAHLMMPVLTAVVLFRYLQSSSSVTMMHALPFSRFKLYISNLISGLLLILSPLFLNGLIMLVIAKPAFNEWAMDPAAQTTAINFFTRSAVLNWMWQSLLIVLVVYAISVFAGLVTANSLMHFATALAFNFLIPGLYAVFVYYFGIYLYGFNLSGDWVNTCLSISPFLEVFNFNGEQGNFPLSHQIYYALNGIFLFVLSAYLYAKRKLEKASESLAFQFMVPIICYLVAFFGMTLLGVWFKSLNQESEFYTYAGYVAGALIFFLIGRMIVLKTPRVFNLNTLKTFGIYSLLAILFFTGLFYDVTGFEKRIPANEKIRVAALEDSFLQSNFDKYASGIYWEYNSSFLYKKSARLKDAANIEAMTRLHKTLLENRSQFENNPDKLIQYNLGFEYSLGSYNKIDRLYAVDYYFLRDNPDLKSIYESVEFKEMYSLKNMKYDKIRSISFSNPIGYDSGSMVRSERDIETILALMDKDFAKESYEEAMSLDWPYAFATINYTLKDPSSGRLNEYTANMIIRESYKNTIEWLDDKGYLEKLLLTDDMISHIGVYYSGSEELVYRDSYGSQTVETKELMEFTVNDRAQITELMKLGKSQNVSYSDYYYGTVYYRNPASTAQGEDYLTLPIYFDSGETPDFILEHFK